MSDAAAAGRRQFGDGPLSAAAALIYQLLVVELLFLVATVPGLLPLLLLERHPSNLPLVALCAVPVGPALSAALYALRHRSRDLTDLAPAAAFWRGYRANLRESLLVWVQGLIPLTLVAVNLGHFAATGLPAWWSVLLVAVGVGVTLWLANALVIVSLFRFRRGDVARLAAYFLVRTPSVPLGTLCLLAVATGVTVLASELVLTLLGSVLALAALASSRPMINRVEQEFTA